MRVRRSPLVPIVAAVLLLLVGAPAWADVDPGTPGDPVDPVLEGQNYSKTLERAAIYSTPEYQAELAVVSAQNAANAAAITAADPERVFLADLCGNQGNGCAGDIRLNDWGPAGYGLVEPVLFTARSGATLSGHVWATKAGPPTRPGVVITNGSVQADEQLYWYAAQSLAKAGYVVLTFDPQGQGQSDTPGVGADLMEGVPAQDDGRPFYDGTVDALDFFLSTPDEAFAPRPSCNSGTSHADKQDRRVAEGFNTAFNPFWALLDPDRVGLAGHSFGAAGASYVAQADPRVKAVVAWDNLGGTDPSERIEDCVDPAQRAVVPITKPGLGISADYFLPPEPNTTVPEPLAKSQSSLAYSAAGVDTGEIVIRGGTHFDFDWIPNQAFGATLRGADLIAWYTNAWMDKYLKADPTADARLLTNRWRTDAASAAVDPTGDPNTLAFYHRSRLDITRAAGGAFRCEDLRAGCAGMVDDDGVSGPFDYLSYVTTPDRADGPVAGPADGPLPGPSGTGGTTTPVASGPGVTGTGARDRTTSSAALASTGPAPAPGVGLAAVVAAGALLLLRRRAGRS